MDHNIFKDAHKVFSSSLSAMPCTQRKVGIDYYCEHMLAIEEVDVKVLQPPKFFDKLRPRHESISIDLDYSLREVAEIQGYLPVEHASLMLYLSFC